MAYHGKGMLKGMVLFALADQELTAYEIKKRIKTGTFNVYEPSSGVLYPILKSLITDGCIEIKKNENKKYYQITEKGKKLAMERRIRLKDLMESEKEKFKFYGKIGMELEILHKIIFTMNEDKITQNNEKILKILREAEDKLKELW
jgi:DNA-binding PadR family transcriptional regulator